MEFKAEWKAGFEFMGTHWLENPSKDIRVEQDEFSAVTVTIRDPKWRSMSLLIDRGRGVTVAVTLGQVVDNAIERMLEEQDRKIDKSLNNVMQMLNKIYLVVRYGNDERLEEMGYFLFHDIPFVVEEETTAVYGTNGLDDPYARFTEVKLYKEGEPGIESAGLSAEEAGNIYAGLSKKMAESNSGLKFKEASVDHSHTMDAFTGAIYGFEAMREKKDGVDLDPFLEITEEMYQTYLKKNADYGNSFDQSLDEFGLTASVVRIQDKLNRLKKLSRNFEEAPEVVDESVGDTLLDLANYAILTVKWLKND